MKTKDNGNTFVSNTFLVLVVASVLFISRAYILPFCWACLLTIASWKCYEFVEKKICRGKRTLAALLCTIILAVVLITPLTLIIKQIISEINTVVIPFLHSNDATGAKEPAGLANIPVIGQRLHHLWSEYLAKPQVIQNLNHKFNQFLHSHMPSLLSTFKNIISIIVTHAISIFFFVMSVFFLYRDGQTIGRKIQIAGTNLLGSKWNTYFLKLPRATRAIVNGSVLVGMLIGFLMGICYWILDLPAPVLFGILTAVLAMIPFGITIAVILVSIMLLANGHLYGAIFIIVFGAAVTFLTDNILKPHIIGNSTELPFLMIFIGILGGVETLGMIGLFVGPIIMLLMYTLICELSDKKHLA
jgi:predicted PurR-regulated permease PerM